MKTNKFKNSILVLLPLLLLLTGCPGKKFTTSSQEYINLKQTDTDFIFFENLKYVFNDTTTNYKGDKNYSNKSFRNFAARIKHQGQQVDYDSAKQCIDSFRTAMLDNAHPINWSEEESPLITYYANYGGQKLLKWLRDDLNLKDPSVKLHIRAKLGMYTSAYVTTHSLDDEDVGRIAIFLFPVDPTGDDLRVSGKNAPVYNLGGLYP